jgi:L-lactate dehydrogenase complex protein LldG
MTAAREEVLSRIRTAIGPDRTEVSVPREYRRAGQASAAGSEELVGQLTDRLLDYRANVLRSSPAEAALVTAGILGGRSIQRLLVPDGFPGELLSAASVEKIRDYDLSTAELDGCDGTVTTCALAIAETGTIVLDAGPGQGRRALSLVPDYLLVVLRVDQIVALVADGVAGIDPNRAQTWISGPSATSDIELKRVEGVHGPRTLDVLILG